MFINTPMMRFAAFVLMLQGALFGDVTPVMASWATFFSPVPSTTTPALPASCEKDMSFNRWLEDVKKEALARKISQNTLAQVLPYMTYNVAVVKHDHEQGVFQQSFLKFADRMASNDRLIKGLRLIRKNKALFDQIERIYGVPPEPLVAFWGLETDFGANRGSFPVITAVTTLAYDCRRADFFRGQLFGALSLVNGGDLKPQDMTGNWAGELGGLQFTPSDYFTYAVDGDGDGHRDLVHNVSDTLASGANFLKHLGWSAGEPWLVEVRAPADMPWAEADISIQHTQMQWQTWGVKTVDGQDLPASALPSSLLLPMGRFGPAFLAYPNFNAFLGWNSALVYSTTAAYFATRFTGAPKMRSGNGVVEVLSPSQITALQTLLKNQVYYVGVVDGKLGAATRTAVKKFQIKLGLPADSYPTSALLKQEPGSSFRVTERQKQAGR